MKRDTGGQYFGGGECGAAGTNVCGLRRESGGAVRATKTAVKDIEQRAKFSEESSRRWNVLLHGEGTPNLYASKNLYGYHQKVSDVCVAVLRARQHARVPR